MNVQVTFRNFEHTEALDGIIAKKSKKLKKYLPTNANLVWNCFVDSSEQVCEVSASGFSGPEIQATAKSESLYKSIDQVIEKLERQLGKKQRNLKMKIHDKTRRDFSVPEAS